MTKSDQNDNWTKPKQFETVKTKIKQAKLLHFSQTKLPMQTNQTNHTTNWTRTLFFKHQDRVKFFCQINRITEYVDQPTKGSAGDRTLKEEQQSINGIVLEVL